MPTIVIIVFGTLILLWVTSRLLAWLIQWQLSKRLKIGVKIGKVGFFSLRNVQIIFRNGLSVEIDQVWLSSCYVSQDVRKPLVLCTGDMRIQTDVGMSYSSEPPDPGGGNPQQRGEATSETSSQPGEATAVAYRQRMWLNMITYLQFVGFRAENVTVILLKTMVEDCLIHLTVQQVNLDMSLHTDSFQVCGNLVSTSCKALRGSTGDQLSNQPSCLADASISTFVDLRIDREDVRRIKVLDVLVSKPQLMITDGILNNLQTWRKGRTTPSDRRKGSCEGSTDLPLLLPRDVSFTVSELDVKVVRETKQRTLSVALKRFHAGLQSSETGQFSPDVTASLSITEFLTQSPQATFASLNKLSVRLQTQPHRVEMNTQLHQIFFHYHHDELQYWANVIKPASSPGEVTPQTSLSHISVGYADERDLKGKPEGMSAVLGHKLSVFLEDKKISSVVEVVDTSFTVSSASCSGFNAGVAQTKLTCTVKPGLADVSHAMWLMSRDIACELEIQTVYACLCDSQVPLSDLTYKQHYWNYILNLTIVIFKAKKLGKELKFEGMVDNVQSEWSTAALTSCLQLIGAVSKGKPAPVAVRHLTPPKKKTEKQTWIDINLLTINFNLSNVNIFVCNDYKTCIMLRVDSLGLELRHQQSVVQSCGMKVVYLEQAGKSCVIRKSVDMSSPVIHILEIRLTYKHREREANVQIMRRVFCLWHTSFHMCIQQLIQDLQLLRENLTGLGLKADKPVTSQQEHKLKSATEGGQPSLSINLILHADTYIGAQLSSINRVAIKTEDVLLTATLPHLLTEIESVEIVFDDRNIISLKGVCVSTLKPHHLKKEREATESLQLETNKAWCVSFNRFEVVFPYQYNFAACYEELINIWKWLKLVHRMKKKPFTVSSPLPPDLQIKVKTLMVRLSDDPFEVKLGDNYELLKDECVESEKRKSVMDQKIQSLRKTHALLPVGKVSELYNSLAKKSAEIYIQRSRKLYNEAPVRTKLLTWTLDHLNIIALADTSIHGKENVVEAMREIDSDSPYPEEGLEFTTLWCRMVNVKVKKWLLLLRDYPQPMMDISEVNVWGKLIGAEQEAAKRAKRSCTVEVAEPWGDVQVERSMPPLKFFHDFSCDVASFTVTYGAAWEPSVAHFNLALDLVNKASIDPSRPMPWWDKGRLLFHGRLTMSLQKMSWLYHASLDPFNTTELMDWTWSNLIMDWTNAQFLLKGDLDIYARTASKYDDCCLLHLPNLRFRVRLEWLCLGDPNDHHAVMPCAPDKTPEYSLEEHDSFRAFRSQNLNLHLSLETRPIVKNLNNIPVCVFYASTLRFLDQIKLCLGSVTRPIKRGPLFNNSKPRKVQLSRHYRHVTLSMNFPQFSICYWMSFAHQHGAELLAESFTLQSDYELSLVPIDDGLKHRPQASWSVRKLNCELSEATVWLCSSHSESEEQVELNVSMRKPVDRSFFISIARVSYHRADESEQEMAADKGYDHFMPTHRVQIYDMRGAWIKSNRNVLFGLFDAFTKAKSLKRNLSSDALKGFKVDSSQQSMKSRASSTNSNPSNDVSPSTATPSPLTRLQTSHALSMLHRLVAETDSKSVAFTEEPSGSNMEQLHGVAACQTDTVVGKDWHIEIHNSQVVLKGVETPGYVIVSMACGQILSSTHQPIWRKGQLRSKKTWVGSVDCMQYYATVDPGHEFSNNNMSWLSMENVEDRSEQDLEGVPEMVGSGLSVGGVVSSTVGATGEDPTDTGIQLQRIISRCKAQFFYASYGEVNPMSVPNVPLPPTEDSDVMMEREEGVDTFTLLHHDLNISSNPMQYKMILDIVNNLLLYVEPKQKEAGEKLQSLKFQVLLAREEDQKTPILQLQERVREHVQRFRRLEKSLYSVQKALDENPGNHPLNEEIEDLEKALYECKAQMNILNEELTTRISCFKDSQLQVKANPSATEGTSEESQVTRRNEVCFKFAKWRLTQTDGQLGIADLSLRNFVYTKVNRDNDSWSHQLELGWVKMANLLPNTIYKDVLVPLDPLMKDGENRHLTLRILCSERPPVGGIAVKEHFEVNVVPMQIQLTFEFFKTMMGFFFPGKEIDTDDDEYAEDNSGKKKSEKKHGSKEKGDKKGTLPKVPSSSSIDDIDKMKERAAQNNTFVYIKIPEVPLRVSYKGEKEKNIEDVHDFSLVLPMMEYHNCIWTWFDLLIAMKNDSKRVLISQAIKQKLHMRSRAGEEGPMTDVQQEEDKAKMLLGAKLLAGQDKPAKKSLFGKLHIQK